MENIYVPISKFNSYIYVQLIFDRGTVGKSGPFKVLRPLNIHRNLDLYLTPYIKIHLKQLISPNLRPKTIKLPGQNTGENLCDFELGREI